MIFNFSTLLSVSILVAQINALAFPKGDIIKRDGVSALKLGFNVQKRAVESPVHKRGDVSVSSVHDEYTYLADIQFGSEKDTASVIIDTGSDDLWVASVSAGGPYDPSKSTTYKDLGEKYEVTYAKGSATGTWGQDTIHIGDEATEVKLFDFGVVASNADYDFNGTLGIGFSSSSHPNLPVALKNQGIIDKVGYSLYLTDKATSSGTILFGAVDQAKYEGDLVKVPTSVDGRLAVQVDSFSIAGNTVSTPFNAVLDSGTSYSYLPDAVLNLIKSQAYALFGNTVPDKYLEFTIGNTVFKVPYSEFYKYNGNGGWTLTVGSDGGGVSVLGDTFLRHAYVVYDLEDKEVSLAPIKYTDESNIVAL